MLFRIVITTTLNNNLFYAKLMPLLRAREDLEIVVVSDRPGPAMDRVRWVWPRGAVAKLGRLGGRLPLLLREVMNRKTRLVMAYSLIPHGTFAIAVGHFFRKPVYVHYIGGQAEIQFAHNKAVADNRVILASKHPQKLERLARKMGKKADLVFVPGLNTEKFLHREGYDPARVIRLHSSVDLQRFNPGNSERDFDVLISAQLRERKRPIFTLQVLREILNRRPETRFCWLGDGPMHDEFSHALEAYGLRPYVIWTETDEVADFYRRGRIFLLCSLSEGLSLACMEAMACGMVPVASDCGDMEDIVREGQTGELLPVTAPVAAYAESVLKLMNDEARFTQFSRASIDLIRREHSFESATAAWRRLLEPFARSDKPQGEPAKGSVTA